jgi:hypothetical protein
MSVVRIALGVMFSSAYEERPVVLERLLATVMVAYWCLLMPGWGPAAAYGCLIGHKVYSRSLPPFVRYYKTGMDRGSDFECEFRA